MRTESFRDEFPINESYLFFNHAGVSPIPLVGVEALEEYALESSQNALITGRAYARVNSLRGLIAEKINCKPSEIALCLNTTAAISILANGVDWQPGDKVVLADVEYPANVYPWWAQEHRGVQLKFVRPQNGRIDLESYYQAVDDRTRVVTVSHVQFAAGFRIDLHALGAFCKERGILLVVDAIQSCGALPINVKRPHIRTLACATQKWLLSPPGLGFLYCEKELCEKLRASSPGAESAVRPGEFLDYDLTYAEGARRFEAGCISLPAAYALEAVLKIMRQAGEEWIQQRIKHLIDRLCAGLEEHGYEVYSSRNENEWSGIVIFTHEDRSSRHIVSALAKNRIIASVRSEGVRVAPHFYNTDEQVDALLATLP